MSTRDARVEPSAAARLAPESDAQKDTLQRTATSVLKRLHLTTSRARSDCLGWFAKLESAQRSGDTLSVLDHVALALVLRSHFLEDQKDAPLASMRQVLIRSWSDLTGQPTQPLSKVLTQPLPASALVGLPNAVQRFNALAYRIDPKTLLLKQSKLTRALALVAPWTLLAVGITHVGGDLVSGAAEGYVASAAYEYLFHRSIMHASPSRREAFEAMAVKGIPPGEGLRRLADSHRAHHLITNGANYTDNPVSLEHPRAQTAMRTVEMHEAHKPAFFATRLGITMEKHNVLSSVTFFSAVTALLDTALSHFTGAGWTHVIAATGVSGLFAAHVNLYHSYMHIPSEVDERYTPVSRVWQWALRKADPLVQWTVRSPYYRDTFLRHLVHHGDGKQIANFSILPGGFDATLGTTRQPSLRELVSAVEQDARF